MENLYKRFRLPDKIISDRGPQFTSKSFVELLKLLGITSTLLMAYHPQMDGTTEQVNQEIEAYLSIYCTSHPEEWLSAIHTLEFMHNNWRHADWQTTPFELMFGSSPLAIPYTFKNMKFPNLEDKMKTLQKNREEALVAHELARTWMTEQGKSTFIPFKQGMVGHAKHKNELSQEDWTQKGRSFQNSQGNRTSNLSTKASIHMEDSPRVLHYFTKAVQGNWHLWGKFP